MPFTREAKSHKHIQRMSPTGLAAIDREVERLQNDGEENMNRTKLVERALDEYFERHPAETPA